MLKDKWKSGGNFADNDLLNGVRFAVFPVIAIVLIIVIMRMDHAQRAGQEQESGTNATVLAGAAGPESAADSGEAGGFGPESAADSGESGASGPDFAGGGEHGAAGLDPAAGGEEPAAGTAGADAPEPAAGADDPDTAAGADDPDTAGGQPGSGGLQASDIYADIDISGYELKKDEIPELTALVITYCQAKEDCDPELMASLFGRSGLTDEEEEAERARMELVKASIKRYENVSCYSIEGPVPDTYVIFPYFELKYRDTDTLMPQLTWAYVTKTEEGRFVMNETVSEAVAAYIARIGEKEDVAALRSQVAAAAAAAVESDPKLKSIYSPESEVVIGE